MLLLLLAGFFVAGKKEAWRWSWKSMSYHFLLSFFLYCNTCVIVKFVLCLKLNSMATLLRWLERECRTTTFEQIPKRKIIDLAGRGQSGKCLKDILKKFLCTQRISFWYFEYQQPAENYSFVRAGAILTTCQYIKADS